MGIPITGVNPEQVVLPKFIAVLQLPTYPVSPPVGGEALGLITWDQPEMVLYVPPTELKAYVEMSNPTAEDQLYAVSYYFLDPDGVIAEEGFVTFKTDSMDFTCFYLPPQSPQPAFFEIGFSVSDVDYCFGLRLLLCEMTDSTARVIQECSRVQIMLASEATWNKYQAPSWTSMIGMVMPVMLLGMLGVVITNQFKGG